MLLKIVMLLRLVAFMVLMYLALAWFVERRSTNPRGRSGPSSASSVARSPCRSRGCCGPGTSYERVLVVSMALVGAVWAVLIVVNWLLVRS